MAPEDMVVMPVEPTSEPTNEGISVLRAGELSLQTRLTSSYEESYSDRGTGNGKDLSVWAPCLLPGEYRIMYRTSNTRNAPSERLPVVKDEVGFALAPPMHFECIWTDKETGGDKDGQLWKAVPPTGYVALSDVAVHMDSGSTSPGSTISPDAVDPSFRCVHSSLVTIADLGECVWSAAGSGGKYDGACWLIPATGAFIASRGLASRPSDAQNKLSDQIELAIGADDELQDEPCQTTEDVDNAKADAKEGP